MKKNICKTLQTIPGVGPKLSKEFVDIGIKKIEDFKNKNPEELYFRICDKQGAQVDKCVLYVCRLSVYFAEHKKHDLEKLKWWNWKDKK